MIATETYEIREIKPQDALGVFDLIMQFRKEAKDKTMMPFNAKILWQRIMESIRFGFPYTLIAKKEDKVIGLISVAIMKSFFDENKVIALELGFYIDPSYRSFKLASSMLDALERKMEEKGAALLILLIGYYPLNMGVSKKLEKFYNRKGFKKLEMHYCKEIGGKRWVYQEQL